MEISSSVRVSCALNNTGAEPAISNRSPPAKLPFDFPSLSFQLSKKAAGRGDRSDGTPRRSAGQSAATELFGPRSSGQLLSSMYRRPCASCGSAAHRDRSPDRILSCTRSPEAPAVPTTTPEAKLAEQFPEFKQICDRA